MQRVAIARAAIARPKILFADEPTGNLDSHNGEVVMKILLEMNQQSTLVLVTHNPQLAALADREIQLRDGRISRIVAHHRKGAAANGKKRTVAAAPRRKTRTTAAR